MSIKTEINRISTNVSNTLSAISEMGGEVPEGATSNDMASGVRSIPVGAKIDDTTPSTSTTYSSSKIESKLTALNDANAALIEVSKTEPNTENTELWIHPNADEVQLPQINDSVESEQDTWSSKKIAAEVSKKANDVDLAAVAKSGSYNDLTDKPTIPTVPSALPNPNALTFTGAVSKTYDGSTAVSVEIPTGGAGGIYPVVSMTDATAELLPNTFYRWGEIAALSITLATPTNEAITNEYCFEFVSGSTATTLTVPDTIRWAQEPSIDTGKTYQVSILNGIGVIVGA